MDPIALARQVEERYRRYLKTTFYFKDPDLRISFKEALNSGQLSKGPYLEATPVFKRGQTPKDLFKSLFGFEPDEGFSKSISGERPLYKHQEQAIKSVHSGGNVIIATGTGSGKTEAFLYPILLHLYQEFRARLLSPGVRALILYPMNALANDQRERLGDICKRLKDDNSPFEFTFGQYIGETPEDENDSKRHARDHMANQLPGELVLRSEMRRTPPHILLTNYSMLEYLLLRPDDSPLFDHRSARWWTFLVLDEAHQYRGSRGIEMAMLLRRLKRRLREGGRSEPFRCIATSATLAGGEGDRSAVAKFASDLFGEKFHEENVILGETEPIPEPSPESLSLEEYLILNEVLLEKKIEVGSRLSQLANKLGVSLPGKEDLLKSVGRILQQDHRSANLRNLITLKNNETNKSKMPDIAKPAQVQTIANQVFHDLPEEKRMSALSGLVQLLLQAEDPSSGAPLLSARYHLFLRSLEGAFVSYWPMKRVFLDRKSIEEEKTAFEVALCRECGQHYFVAHKNFNGGKIKEAIRDPNDINFGATFLRPIEPVEMEAEASSDDENGGTKSKAVFYLCVQCGEAQRNRLACGHDHLIQVIREDPPNDEDRADQLARCGACGYNAAGRDPVREVVHGADGPHAVIATTLYEKLERKKVLAFADSRQEAAFFAWYLGDSYKDILSRNLILKVARSFTPYPAEGVSLSTVADRAFHDYGSAFKQKEAEDEATTRKNIWLALYREFLTDEQRISLEGVGLMRLDIKWPEWFEIPHVLKDSPWSLTDPEACDLIFLLLETMRTDKAVELRTGSGVSLNWNDLNLQASQKRFGIGEPKGKKSVRSWDSKRGKRARFLAKLLMKIENGISEDRALELELAVDTLRVIWDAFRLCDQGAPSSNDRLLFSIEDTRRLNPEWWRFCLIRSDDTIYQCDTCGRLRAVSVHEVCPRHRCPGTLREIKLRELEPNHYRLLYEASLPSSLRVEEHTAQLDKEKAREFQKEFREGKIHILSCSTTFELGVDLGDLDTIFLRNVPPETFNYAQRVGRAGRRSGYPGFAITYCRRGPHDLYYFSEPERMLAGKVRPPVLSLQNEKIISRHIMAVALSSFFRAFPERFRTVESLFSDLEHPSGVVDFKSFLRNHKTELEESFRAILPSNMIAQIGLADRSWIEKAIGEDTGFSLAEAEVSGDYRTVKSLETAAAREGDYDTANWAKARAKTIADEPVLSFLSRKAVIPKYGFPVDIVELDTQRTQQNQESFEILLQRDLSIAISEFAPTSKLVANKKLWTSYGLKKVVGKEWERKFYKRCVRHNVFFQWKRNEPEPVTPCGDQLTVSQYVIPLFGFVTDRDKPKEPKSRTTRVFTTRPYFAGPLSPDPGTITLPLNAPMITMKKASPGLMTVLCEGRRGEGFYICGDCGAGFRKRERAHGSPYGQHCNGTLERVSLGHEFVTDVLQLQFHSKPKGHIESVWFAYSLSFALVEGAADVLDIPPTDLSATVAHSEQYPVPPIILYDNVPGGAGLVARLEAAEVFKDCMIAAQKRVSGNCGCDEMTSCYGCLRSFRNQFAHQFLQRGPVLYYIEALLSEWQ